MTKKTITLYIEWDEYESAESLDTESKLLLEKARNISRKAYAPYSRFKVGAAVLVENGEIILGTNQENSAYPDGLCAERVAIYAASTQYPNMRIKKIAVAAYSEKNERFVGGAPCGSCRQALLEYEVKQKSPIKVINVMKGEKIIIFNRVEDLLPVAFSKKELE